MTLAEMVLAFCATYPCPTKDLPQPIAQGKAQYIQVLEQISKNPSREAALTEQESAWRVRAKSPYAKGLRQFTDKTGRHVAKTICRDLGNYRPYDPMWSLRCGVRYVEWLETYNTLPPKYKKDYCFNRRVAEQMYNGGSAILRELKSARYFTFEEARKVCERATWACKENYEYPKKIDEKQKKYDKQGVPGIPCYKENE